MPNRPIMDPTKAPCGALTMVYEDYEMLRRWVGYYGAQFGRQHLYILSHGGDPEHRRIADGCNVIAVPRDPTCYRLERRRWGMYSDFHAGLMRYFNWLVVGDVDEMVLLDPDAGDTLIEYLKRYEYSAEGADIPKSLSPFGIELIHNPEVETDAIEPDAPILQKRRVFRANANYAKPCVLRTPARFSIGGHSSSHQPRFLDPHLYLLHLRFFDFELSKARLLGRQEIRKTMDGEKDPSATGHAWKKDLDNFLKLSKGEAVREDCQLEEFRRKMVDDQKHLHDGKVSFWGGGRSRELYRLPKRFASLV